MWYNYKFVTLCELWTISAASDMRSFSYNVPYYFVLTAMFSATFSRRIINKRFCLLVLSSLLLNHFCKISFGDSISGYVSPIFFLQSCAGRNQSSKSVKASDTICSVLNIRSFHFRTVQSVCPCSLIWCGVNSGHFFSSVHAY